jgi:hypothetical protein
LTQSADPEKLSHPEKPMLPAPKKPPAPTMGTYLSKRVHGGVRAGDKSDNVRLMALARKIIAERAAISKP